jgi:hypothetical protein
MTTYFKLVFLYDTMDRNTDEDLVDFSGFGQFLLVIELTVSAFGLLEAFEEELVKKL